MKDTQDKNLKITRSIKLPSGNDFEVVFSESFENKIKKMYKTELVTDQLILDFFKSSLSSAIESAEKTSD